jgi:hypothetical protein
VQFRRFDANCDTLGDDQRYDVAFMLSVHNHLKCHKGLVDIVKRHINEAVVFEGHSNTNLDDYSAFLDAIGFARIERLASCATSVFDGARTRPCWILYK